MLLLWIDSSSSSCRSKILLLGRASPHGVIEKSSPCSDDKQVSSLTIRMVLYRIIIIIIIINIIIIIVIQSQHMK